MPTHAMGVPVSAPRAGDSGGSLLEPKRETSYSSQDGSSHHDEIRHVVIDRPSQPHNPLQAHHSRFVQFRNQECGVNLMAGAMSSMLA